MEHSRQRQNSDAYLIREEDQGRSSHSKFLAAIVVLHGTVRCIVICGRRRVVRRGLSLIVSSISALCCVRFITEIVGDVAVGPHGVLHFVDRRVSDQRE